MRFVAGSPLPATTRSTWPSRYATAKPLPVLHAGWLTAVRLVSVHFKVPAASTATSWRPSDPTTWSPCGDQPASEKAPSRRELPSGRMAYAPLREMASTEPPLGRAANAGLALLGSFWNRSPIHAPAGDSAVARSRQIRAPTRTRRHRIG